MLGVHALYPLVSTICLFFRRSVLHSKMQKLIYLLVLFCSPSSILCTFSSFSSTFLHGARPTGDWLNGWSRFKDNTCSRRLRRQAIAGLEGKCKESNVLLLVSEAVWKCMDGGTWSKHYPSNSYLYISDSSAMFLIIDPWL